MWPRCSCFVCVAKVLSLSYTSRVRELGEMCLLAGILAVQTVIWKRKSNSHKQPRNLNQWLSKTNVGKNKQCFPPFQTKNVTSEVDKLQHPPPIAQRNCQIWKLFENENTVWMWMTSHAWFLGTCLFSNNLLMVLVGKWSCLSVAELWRVFI